VKTLSALTVALLAFAGSAMGEQFWIEYDASCGQYPEQVGWDHLAMGGGAQRSLDGGVLTLDGLASTTIVDDYGMLHPIELASGESFLMEWRLRVDEVHGFADPAVGVWSEGNGRLALDYSETSIYSLLEGVWIDFEPHVFHDYSLVSTDMRTYTLLIDGSAAYTGHFVSPCTLSGVDWGDEISGARSLSEWQYVRFGVVPEPTAALLLAFACLPAMPLRARRTRRNTNES
jgi:hypothetical protein